MHVIDALRRLLTSAYVLHMEREIEHLRGQVSMLQLQLLDAVKPKPAPVVARSFPKFVPVKTSWDKYLEEEMKRQEAEETATDGTSSSGR